MKFYIAARFEQRIQLKPVRDTLVNMGIQVTSSWLDEPVTENFESLTAELSRKLAIRDLAEIKEADVFIIDINEEAPRGGREVELGWALAHLKEVWLVGEKPRNIFQCLGDRHYENWAQLLSDQQTGEVDSSQIV